MYNYPFTLEHIKYLVEIYNYQEYFEEVYTTKEEDLDLNYISAKLSNYIFFPPN